MASQRSKTLLLIHLLGTLGMTSAGDVFAVTSESQCAKELPFGNCLAPIDKDSSAFVCTNFKNVVHNAFTQDFYMNDELQFTIDWAFQSGSKTLQKRFEDAVATGEVVVWTVNTAPGISFNGITSKVHSGVWRFSSASSAQSPFDQFSGTGFSENGGSWGAAFTDSGPHGGWGHENKNSADMFKCRQWYTNGDSHQTGPIRNVMSFKSYQGTCFHGATLLTLKDKTTKTMSELEVGDKIQTSDEYGNLGFSPVITLPHKMGNSEIAIFLKLTTETEKSVSMTPGHLLPLCDGRCVTASMLVVGDCLLTVDGKETLIEITSAEKNGVYTAITKDKFIVADGIIASPYSVVNNPARPDQENGVSSVVMNYLERFAFKTGLNLRGSQE